MTVELECLLRKERPNRRVLSIQSHVVSGYAGNKCSIFPLQLHGFEVDSINSVQFSNHTGYPGGVTGNRLNDRDLKELYRGLKTNALNHYSHVLSGYCGDASFLRQIAEIVKDLRVSNEHLTYICDPVLGDNGKYYVPKELTEIYLNEVLPLADVITPNVFELGELVGATIRTEAECLAAINKMHSLGARIVVVTSGIYRDEHTFYCYASEKGPGVSHHQYRFDIPIVRGHFVGTGDVFSSLLLVWLEETQRDLMKSVQAVIASMQLLLRRTSTEAYAGDEKPSAAQMELRLIQSRYDLLVPHFDVKSKKLD